MGVAGFSETLLAKYTASYSGRRNCGHVNVISFIVGLFNDALNIIIFINCNWVVTRWQWLFYMYTKYEIGY